jgi:hypothetical protein
MQSGYHYQSSHLNVSPTSSFVICTQLTTFHALPASTQLRYSTIKPIAQNPIRPMTEPCNANLPAPAVVTVGGLVVVAFGTVAGDVVVVRVAIKLLAAWTKIPNNS